ncbi:MAG: DUF3795 domain-containing protein [Spirochaetes bacterium]|nr:DUF3795 domain-containing protein [Spirochaetota bacterium]
MKEKMDKIGACGDDCSCCPRYTAESGGNKKELMRVRDLWVSFGWRDSGVDYRELECPGCLKENKCAYEKLRDCAFHKGLANCGECGMYPCSLNLEAFERTEKLFAACNWTECSREERISIERSFNRKKFNLDRIHSEHSARD